MISQDQQILINRSGTQFGPYPLEEAKIHFLSGHIVPTDTARAGGDAWRPVTDVLGMAPPPPKPDSESALPPLGSSGPFAAKLSAAAAATVPWCKRRWEALMSADTQRVGKVPPAWYKKTWVQVVTLLLVPFVQVPLMWYFKLFTQRLRVVVSVVGCIWLLIALCQPSSSPETKTVYNNGYILGNSQQINYPAPCDTLYTMARIMYGNGDKKYWPAFWQGYKDGYSHQGMQLDPER